MEDGHRCFLAKEAVARTPRHPLRKLIETNLLVSLVLGQ